MKCFLQLFARLVFLFFFFQTAAQKVSQHKSRPVEMDAEKVFLSPPSSAKPGVLWMWMGANISKEGITKDLEALKQQGFNRTTMFSLADITTPWSGVIGKSVTPEIIAWTEPWWKMVRHAAEESKRLGMDFGMFNGAGYEASGGVWITPELSMQEICWSQTNVSGNKHLTIVLPKASVNPQGHTPFPIYNGETGLVEKPKVAARNTYYKEIAVIAVPAEGNITVNDVIDISNHMKTDGTLEWDAPAGNWSIYRFGHTTTGTYIQPAQWKATGLECDKMSREAVSFHIDHIITEIQKHLGDLIGKGFTHVHFDSYEAGVSNWTPKMKEEFSKRRGYDLTRFLPLFAGRRIGNKQDSISFRKDFDATVKDLHRDVYFTTLSEKLKAAHLEFLCEPYGGPWRQDDVMPLVGRVMTEFWTHKGKFSPYELKPTVNALRKSGQNIIEAEAFTGDPSDSKWDETPAWLKPIGDAAFCEGVNRLVLHRFVQQAFDDRYKPGATMGRWGTHFDRTQTWWKPSKAMIQYWQRCQALLQWGNIVLPDKNDFVMADTSLHDIKYIHRKQNDADIYFVANTDRTAAQTNCTFAVSDRLPELWDAVTGKMRMLPEYTITANGITIPLQFDAAQSCFIVFRKRKKENELIANKNYPSKKEIKTLNAPWTVQFDKQWGGPAKAVSFNSLEDWTANTNPGIKYFSGTAVYTQNFILKASDIKNAASLYLELGKVNHIAKVVCNGKDLGIVWTAPWHIQIPKQFLKTGNNYLQIEVTNVWANRLIGDEQEPEDCEWLPGHLTGGNSLKEFPDWFLNKQSRPSKNRYCFTTWNYFTKESPLISSGLLGPVRLVSEE